MRVCGLETCDRPYYAKGWCQPHYSRVLQQGELKPDVPIRRVGNVPDTTRDDDWMQRARCRPPADHDVFFPEVGGDSPAQEARAICHTCPVIEECLEFALKYDFRYGVWGGLSEMQRRPLHRKYGQRVRTA